jgi:hypothetical protein
VRQTQQLAIGHTANEAVLKISQVLETMWIKVLESPQGELRGKRDENSDRRGDRCDWPAVDSSIESEPA